MALTVCATVRQPEFPPQEGPSRESYGQGRAAMPDVPYAPSVDPSTSTLLT